MSREAVLITGGAGFVGSNLAIRYRERHPGVRVVALDNLKRRGSDLNIPRLRQAGVEFVHGDIRNREDLPEHDVDLILECSAEPSVLSGYGGRPDYLINTNLVGTLNCLEFARARRADFIFLSTSRVYSIRTLSDLRYREEEKRFVLSGEQPHPGASAAGIAEDFPIRGPRSLYGATKLASELFIEEYRAAYGLRAVVNRCGVIAGPWQMGRVDQGVFALWVARHHFGGELDYIGYGGSGKQVRDLLHIDDLFELVDLQAQRPGLFDGRTLNVGGGPQTSLSLLETTELCQRITGRRIRIRREPEQRPADVPIYISDHRKATDLCGWRPTRSAGRTLSDVHEWIRENEPLVREIFMA
ncbi:MAG: NAD-dependent epimerase/dehydratase family protein [Actinomycetota bacterium]